MRSLLSRAEFSSDHWHPAYQSLLVTSRHYVAFVSQEAGTWTLISTADVVVGHGRMRMGEGFRAISAAVTDSGRLFVSGLRSDGRRFTMFELGGATVAIDTSGFVAAERFGPLAGSDGGELGISLRPRRGVHLGKPSSKRKVRFRTARQWMFRNLTRDQSRIVTEAAERPSLARLGRAPQLLLEQDPRRSTRKRR